MKRRFLHTGIKGALMAGDDKPAPADPVSRAYLWSGYLQGFAFAGFLDGILLHQVLQWHHLLSSVSGPISDLRTQILADGLFHALMYIILIAGLCLLWRARGDLIHNGAGRTLIASLFIGFGAWHVFDGIVVHGLLRLHHIKPDSPFVFAWDLLFLGLGVICMCIGMVLRRRRNGGPGKGEAAIIAGVILLAGILALMPVRQQSAVTVVFGPQTAPREIMRAASAAKADLLWTDGRGVWVLTNVHSILPLYSHGAWLVSGAYSGTGCYGPDSLGKI